MWRVAAVMLAFIAAGCGAPEERRTEMPTMQTRDEIAAALRTLGDDAFSASDKDLVARGYKALERKDFDAIVVRAPSRVDVRKQAKLPALVAVGQADQRGRDVPLGKNAVLVITRPGRGGCWIAHPYAPPPNKNAFPPGDPRKPPDPPPSPDVSNARGKGIRMVNARAEDMPWEAGRLALRIISADWCSNVETVVLEGGDKPPAAPARVSLPAAGDFAKSAGHPALKGTGVALAVTGGVARGSLRLKKDPDWPVTEDGKSAIPFVILLKRQGVLNPIVMELHAPATAGEEAESWFAVDLRSAFAEEPLEEKCWAYLLAGDDVDGPRAVEFQ